MEPVVIIGGGFAGLSAAVSLCRNGIPVVLLERCRHPGGRAFSFQDPVTGDTLDNGQHLFMRCYRHTLEFLSRIGTVHRLQFQDRFRAHFHSLRHGPGVLALPRGLPAPLALAVGLLRYRLVGTRDLLGLRAISRALTVPFVDDTTADAWLARCGQSSRIREAFWDPLCLSALNQAPKSASAQHLAAVLQTAFMDGVDGACLGHTTVGLSELYANDAARFVESHSGAIQLGTTAARIDSDPTGGLHVTLRSGDRLGARAVICAVTPRDLGPMLPEALRDLKESLCSFRPSPIHSVNLWFDRQVLDVPALGMLGTTMDWAFDRHALHGNVVPGSPRQVSLVASAADALSGASRDDLVAMALEDLRGVSPRVHRARLLNSRVVRQPLATYVLPVGIRPPSHHTAIPGLYLAGDWTDTGLPATVESAVLSGHRAAQSVLGYVERAPKQA